MVSDTLIYNVIVPGATQPTAESRQGRSTLSEGVLGSDVAAVESISPNAGRQTLSGRYIGPLADLSALELQELFGASIEAVPIFNPDEQGSVDGYYALESADVNPRDARVAEIQEYNATVTGLGTRRSHRRTVRTNPTTEDNPFGSASSEEIGIPARASLVQWYDSSTGALEDATVQRTESGEHDDIDIYDATEPSFDGPTLVYDVAYRHEWPVDVRVWDDYGRAKHRSTSDGTTVGSATVGTATVGSVTEAVQWQRVFSTDHDYRGVPILENDVLRLEFAERDQLRVYEWDTSAKTYERLELGSSPWRLQDVDIVRIGVERIDGQAEFEDVNNPGTTHNLNFSVKRGYSTVFWTVPANESSPPQGLIDRLSPIAHDSDQDPAAVADVIQRTEVDR